MKKTVTSLYQILLGLGIVLMLLSVFVGEAKIMSTASGARELHTVKEQIDEDIREYSLQLESIKRGNSCIAFFTLHQYIWVYQDGELIYSVEDGETIFGNTPGGGWHYVQIDPWAKDVRVRFEAVYPQVRDIRIDFFQGDGQKMAVTSMRRSIFEILISIIDMTLGIIMMVYYIVINKEMLLGRGIWYFGLFSTIVGIWSLNESELMTILVQNRVAASYFGYTLIMLMIAPFVLFVREFFGLGRDKYAYAISIMSFANFIICTILHLTGNFEFKRTVWSSFILMFLSLVYLVYALRYRIKRKGFDRITKNNLLGLILLGGAFVTDMAAYYVGAIRTDVFGRAVFLCYIILVGAEAAKNTVSKISVGHKAEVYRELAVKDILTGLYNRNAYDQWALENQRPRRTAVITFDLNELKQCNDTRGHAAGDKYIQDASALMVKIFEPAGRCYRIGGDEFCAIVENVNEDWIEKRLNELELLEEAYNQKNQSARMWIAHGYAIYDEKIDHSIEQTRERADELMYQNKRLKKKQ